MSNAPPSTVFYMQSVGHTHEYLLCAKDHHVQSNEFAHTPDVVCEAQLVQLGHGGSFGPVAGLWTPLVFVSFPLSFSEPWAGREASSWQRTTVSFEVHLCLVGITHSKKDTCVRLASGAPFILRGSLNFPSLVSGCP